MTADTAHRRLSLAAALLAGAAMWPLAPALANDSSAELSLGGLVFTKSDDVSMEEEDLQISPERTQVRYRFLNQSAQPVTLTVAFPLPDIDLSDFDQDIAIPGSDPVNFVDFHTSVDGKPVPFTAVQKAMMGEKDVTAKVKAAGLPVMPVGPDADALQPRAEALSPAALKDLIDTGILVEAGTGAENRPLYGAGWTVRTSFVRKQTFPPGVPVQVEHVYRTSLGQSLDTVLRSALRRNATFAAEVARYKATYCIDETFLRGIDKIAGTADANSANVQERRISYILKTGANWAGPIRNFRLLVDKGRPDNLVSFCASGLKKISPTAFELRQQDFTPTADLAILLVGTFGAK
jgi:hypothetical protein